MLQTSFETCPNRDSDQLSVEEPILDVADLPFRSEKSGYDKKEHKSRRASKDARQRDVTITLLRKEIECALESLKDVQDEMAKLQEEKKEMSMCGKQSRESIKCLTTQALSLQAAMRHFEEQSKVKVEVLSDKLRNLDKPLKEAVSHWCQMKEVILLLSNIVSNMRPILLFLFSSIHLLIKENFLPTLLAYVIKLFFLVAMHLSSIMLIDTLSL